MNRDQFKRAYGAAEVQFISSTDATQTFTAGVEIYGLHVNNVAGVSERVALNVDGSKVWQADVPANTSASYNFAGRSIRCTTTLTISRPGSGQLDSTIICNRLHATG